MSPERRTAIRRTRLGEGETEVDDQGAETIETGGIQEKGREQGRILLRFAGTGTGGFRS
jgi:hypothetical protein